MAINVPSSLSLSVSLGLVSMVYWVSELVLWWHSLCVCVCVCVCACVCVWACVCDHSWAGGTGLVERAVVNRASMLAGLLTVDLSASLSGMRALGIQAQRSAPGGPNYPVPCAYVKLRRGKILRRSVMDVMCACTCLTLLYTSVQLFSTRVIFIITLSLTHTHTCFLCHLWREIQGGTIGWGKFIGQLSASTVIYQSVYPADVPLPFFSLLSLPHLSPPPILLH